MCYVALDPEEDRVRAASSSEIEKTYEWLRNRPWGFFTVGRERFECPEAMFDPSFVSYLEIDAQERWKSIRLLWIGRRDEGCVFYNAPKDVMQLIQKQCVERGFFARLRAAANVMGIHQAVNCSILRCDDDICAELYGNVVLSGGNSMFPGLADRLQKELVGLAPSAMKIKVIAPPGRKNGAWVGGSMLASQPSFVERLCVMKEEYDEHGPAFVNVKCPGF